MTIFVSKIIIFIANMTIFVTNMKLLVSKLTIFVVKMEILGQIHCKRRDFKMSCQNFFSFYLSRDLKKDVATVFMTSYSGIVLE